MRAILTYHSIDPSGSSISVAEPSFRRHVEWLASGRVRVTTVDGVLERTPTEEAVALTFDDGLDNFRTQAWPLLREHGLPVTLFVATGAVGGTNAWPSGVDPGVPDLPVLDWEALGSLVEEGVTVGAHSRSHPDLRRLHGVALSDEIVGASEAIEREIGKRPTIYAYPYGFHDDRVVEAVSRTYAHACTTDFRPLGSREDPHRLPRLDAYYFRGRFGFERWGSPSFRGYVGLRAAGRWVRSRLPLP